MGSWAEEGASMGSLPLPEAASSQAPHRARSSSFCPRYMAYVPSTTVPDLQNCHHSKSDEVTTTVSSSPMTCLMPT